MRFFRCPKCAIQCGRPYVPYEILRLLIMGFRRMSKSKSESLLKKYLTEELLNKLKFRITENNVTLYDCIRCGLELDDSKIGAFACDAESYFVFSAIFFPILEEIHGFSPTDIHPPSVWTPVETIKNFDSKRNLIKLVKIRISRNLFGFPFCSQMSAKQYERIEEYLMLFLQLMPGEFDGTYEKISIMNEDRKNHLKKLSVLLDNKDKSFANSGCYRYWPLGRGIFMNVKENFFVWINEHDHLKIICLDRNGVFNKTYERAMTAIKILNRDLKFVMSKRMGYVTSNPADMGTGMKVSVTILIPRLAKKENVLTAKAEEFGVDIKRISETEDLYEVSTKKCLGLTEREMIRPIEDAVNRLVFIEEIIG